MQASPSFSTSGSPSWSVVAKQACQEPERVVSAYMQSVLQRTEMSKVIAEATDVEQQLQEEKNRVLHLQRENKELCNKLSQLQQDHRQLQLHYAESKQVLQHQDFDLTEKCNIIQQLQSRLGRLQNLADAVADEVHSCNTMMAPPTGSFAPGIVVPVKVPHIKHDAAVGSDKPTNSSRDLVDSQDQRQAGHQQSSAAANPGRMQQQEDHGSPPTAAETGLASARLQPQAPTIGSKRSRLCSATGSAGGAAANLKRAASGGSGSSSSRQQMSAEEEPLAEGVDEVEPAGCYSAKGQRSPGSSHMLMQAAAATGDARAAPDEHMDVDDDIDNEEKSQDDLEAAECLQALATSDAPEHIQHSPMMRMPSNPLAFEGLGSIFAAAAKVMGSNQLPWPASSQAPAGSGGSAIHPMLMAQLQSYLQGAVGNHADSHERYNLSRASQHLAVTDQPKKSPAANYNQPQQPVKQLHHQHHVVTAGPPNMRRPDGLAAGWATAARMGPAPGSMAAPVRSRKQSWFQTEIAEKIPVSVQQACTQDWAAQQYMQVVCADLTGTFYVNSAGEYLIKLANSGEVVTPNKFEELAGKKTARNWQQSIRLVGYTMNGEPNSALLKLGHFTRIVGLVQDR